MDDLVTRFNAETREAVRDIVRKAVLEGHEADIPSRIEAAFEERKGGKAAPIPPDPRQGEIESLQGMVKALVDHAMTPPPAPVVNVTVPERETHVHVPRQPPAQVNIAEGAFAVNLPAQKATRILRDKSGSIIGSEPVDG